MFICRDRSETCLYKIIAILIYSLLYSCSDKYLINFFVYFTSFSLKALIPKIPLKLSSNCGLYKNIDMIAFSFSPETGFNVGLKLLK